MDEIRFTFLDTIYVLGFTAPSSANGQELHEFVPEGQTVDDWQKLVTVIRDSSRTATPTDLDAVAEATLTDFKDKGAFVYNSFTFPDPKETTRGINVMTVVFSQPSQAEVNLKKIYIGEDGYITAVTYAVRIQGDTSAEIEEQVNAYLQNTQSIGPEFIAFDFPVIK